MALDFETFKKSLKDGKYESLAGARRAVGKAQAFTAEQKESAKKLVDKHFDAAPQAAAKAPKAAAKKTAKAPKAEKKTAKKEAKAAPQKREPKVSAKAEPSKRDPKVTRSIQSSVETLSRLSSMELESNDLKILGDVGPQVRMAMTATKNLSALLTAYGAVKADINHPIVKEALDATSGISAVFRHAQYLIAKAKEEPEAKTRKPRTTVVTSEPVNGASPVKAESLSFGARPDASTVD